MIAFFSEAWGLALRKSRARRDAAERASIAKVFNNRYTYRVQYAKDADHLTGSAMGGFLPRGGNAWMCPECNRIHHPTECSVWDGIHYPACCVHPEGNRLYANIKTGR